MNSYLKHSIYALCNKLVLLSPLLGSQSKSISGGASKYSSSAGQSPLEVINFHDSRFANSVELAVRFGKTLVILEVDTIEPMLYPLIRRDLYTRGPRYVVTIGKECLLTSSIHPCFIKSPYVETAPCNSLRFGFRRQGSRL